MLQGFLCLESGSYGIDNVKVVPYLPIWYVFRILVSTMWPSKFIFISSSFTKLIHILSKMQVINCTYQLFQSQKQVCWTFFLLSENLKFPKDVNAQYVTYFTQVYLLLYTNVAHYSFFAIVFASFWILLISSSILLLYYPMFFLVLLLFCPVILPAILFFSSTKRL